jgi:hypothetical protein
MFTFVNKPNGLSNTTKYISKTGIILYKWVLLLDYYTMLLLKWYEQSLKNMHMFGQYFTFFRFVLNM